MAGGEWLQQTRPRSCAHLGTTSGRGWPRRHARCRLTCLRAGCTLCCLLARCTLCCLLARRRLPGGQHARCRLPGGQHARCTLRCLLARCRLPGGQHARCRLPGGQHARCRLLCCQGRCRLPGGKHTHCCGTTACRRCLQVKNLGLRSHKAAVRPGLDCGHVRTLHGMPTRGLAPAMLLCWAPVRTVRQSQPCKKAWLGQLQGDAVM